MASWPTDGKKSRIH